jgi:hypothetical protein
LTRVSSEFVLDIDFSIDSLGLLPTLPAIDMFQEKVLKEGAQDNESGTEQAKDNMIADALRSGYKNVTGKDIPS